MEEERVILVDEQDTNLGSAERWLAHREGRLHRAVSVFVVNRHGQVLLQRRAAAKPIFGGLWANTCCTHPRPGEDARSAATRRLREEMGIQADLDFCGTFTYQAEDEGSGLMEHELDHVFVGSSGEEPVPDRAEVDEFRWVDVSDLLAELERSEAFAPWVQPALSVAKAKIERG